MSGFRGDAMAQQFDPGTRCRNFACLAKPANPDQDKVVENTSGYVHFLPIEVLLLDRRHTGNYIMGLNSTVNASI